VPLKQLHLTPGQELKIYASIPENRNNFTITIKGEPNNFIFQMKFYAKKEGGTIWWNTKKRNRWNNQLTLSKSWLKPGRPFEMNIKFLDGAFKVKYENLLRSHLKSCDFSRDQKWRK